MRLFILLTKPLILFILLTKPLFLFIYKKVSIFIYLQKSLYFYFILKHKQLMPDLFSACASTFLSASASSVSLACHSLFLFCRIRFSWCFFTPSIFIYLQKSLYFYLSTKQASIFILKHKQLMHNLFSACALTFLSASASSVYLACHSLFLFCRIRFS